MAWPIAKAELDPYQAETAAILDCRSAHQPPDLPMAQSGNGFRDIRFQHSPPTRFGQKYRDEIAAAPRIACCLNANLVDLRLGADLATVTGADFRSYAPGDPGFTVRARVYCLCLGGFENPRMLLNFTGQKPNGHRQRPRPGRPLFLRASSRVGRRRHLRPRAVDRGGQPRADPEFMRARGPSASRSRCPGATSRPTRWRGARRGAECATPSPGGCPSAARAAAEMPLARGRGVPRRRGPTASPRAGSGWRSSRR